MSVVIGLGFGDEGKGLATSFLCSRKPESIVVRFNGGHQAGHTVVHSGTTHVFSTFGSGTLQGVPTFISKFCTFFPPGFLKERNILVAAGVSPEIYIDPLAMVTTPFDIMMNHADPINCGHGTVGVGFGKTIKRNKTPYTLYVQDLFFEKVLTHKLKMIGIYYGFNNKLIETVIEHFLAECKEACLHINISDQSILDNYIAIFEGAQGVLLDMDHGFFPNVTHSNTTSKNSFDLEISDDIFYVTRTYLTRHGAGYLPGEKKIELIANNVETNVTNKYQGEFRTAELDVELLRYAIACDSAYSSSCRKSLIVTCMDQYPIDVDKLIEDIGCEFYNVYLSFSPCWEDVIHIDEWDRSEQVSVKESDPNEYV